MAVELRPHETLQHPQRYDYVVMIGGGGGEVTTVKCSRFLRRAANAQVTLVCVAEAVFNFARLGFLDGYTVSMNRRRAENFTREYRHVKLNYDAEFVADRDRMSAVGASGVVQLVDYVVARQHGYADGQSTNEARYRARDPIVVAVMLAIGQSIGTQCDLSTLAKRFDLSARQLQRRFVADIGISARDYRGHLRACRARWLTEHSTMSLTQVSAECGFADAAHFSSSFRRYFGESPSTLRRSGRLRRE